MLTGIIVNDIPSAEKAALILHSKGIETVIITLGAKGALLFHDNSFSVIETPKVEAVDTTAAGMYLMVRWQSHYQKGYQ